MGRVALTTSSTLTNAALWKARHMAFYNDFAHDDPAPPVARTVPDRLSACGYPASTSGWGENIAWGYATPDSVMTAWLNSTGHRANIENASFRSIGIGVAADANGRLYWVQDFGTVTGGTPPPPPPPAAAAASPAACPSASPAASAPSPPPPPPATTVTAYPSALTLSTGTLARATTAACERSTAARCR